MVPAVHLMLYMLLDLADQSIRLLSRLKVLHAESDRLRAPLPMHLLASRPILASGYPIKLFQHIKD